jgi:hypothetical protein
MPSTETASPQPTFSPAPTLLSNGTILAICRGDEELIFDNGLPLRDPCENIVDPQFAIPGFWIVINPTTNNGVQIGRCLIRYPDDSVEILKGSMRVLLRSNLRSARLPDCPITEPTN